MQPCVVVCCSVLQHEVPVVALDAMKGVQLLLYIAVYCSIVHRNAVCCSVCCSGKSLSWYWMGDGEFAAVAVCCSVLPCAAVCCRVIHGEVNISAVYATGVCSCCVVLQSVAVCCSLLQCCAGWRPCRCIAWNGRFAADAFCCGVMQ